MIRLLFLAFVSVTLSGCIAGVAAVGQSNPVKSLFIDPDVNMAQRNYGAADILVQQANTHIKRRDLIKAVSLIDEDEPRVRAPLGRMIPEQVGIRLSQLGYRVDLSDVARNENVQYLKSSALLANQRPDFVISGSYLRAARNVDVRLRVTDTATGGIVGVFEYIIPYNREIKQLAKPETVIFKVDE